MFGGIVAPGDPPGLTVSFNSGCVWNTYHGHVTEGGDMVLVGTALGTSEDCSLTGDDSEGLMYFGRKGRGDRGGLKDSALAARGQNPPGIRAAMHPRWP
ncbi:MAG: hypothetical protein OXQ93_02525, partial [Gemmatimonadota bacterium]|nr:hypothetical protein [Gemmatimonadota bacterium]